MPAWSEVGAGIAEVPVRLHALGIYLGLEVVDAGAHCGLDDTVFNQQRRGTLCAPVVSTAQTAVHGIVSPRWAQIRRGGIDQRVVVHVVFAAHGAPQLIGRAPAAVDGQLGV